MLPPILQGETDRLFDILDRLPRPFQKNRQFFFASLREEQIENGNSGSFFASYARQRSLVPAVQLESEHPVLYFQIRHTLELSLITCHECGIKE